MTKNKNSGQSLEDEFTEIAQQAIREAEGIKCPLSAFVAGLRTMQSEIRERLSMAESELDAMENASEE